MNSDLIELITDRQRRLYHELSSAEMMVHVQAHGGLPALLHPGLPGSRRAGTGSAGVGTQVFR